jgi:acetyl esterase/lipase
MKSTLLTSAILLIGGLRASAGSLPSPPPDVVAQTVQVEHYPTTNVTLPNGVAGRPALMYSVSNGYRPLTLDLYLPPKALQKPEHGFPLVVYIHGGAWMGGDSHRNGAFVDFPGVLASLSQRGYVVASIEYRLSGEAKFPAPIQDVKRRFAGCGCALPLLNTQSTPRER